MGEIDRRAYLLGVFDGEGCIATGRTNSGGWFVQVRVCMASEPVCRLFEQEWGGHVTMRSKPTVGGLWLWDWVSNSSKALGFLEYISENAVVKREQAVLALRLAQSISKYTWAGHRKGFNLAGGQRRISEEDMAERVEIVRQIRALAGARNRFAHLSP